MRTVRYAHPLLVSATFRSLSFSPRFLRVPFRATSVASRGTRSVSGKDTDKEAKRVERQPIESHSLVIPRLVVPLARSFLVMLLLFSSLRPSLWSPVRHTRPSFVPHGRLRLGRMRRAKRPRVMNGERETSDMTRKPGETEVDAVRTVRLTLPLLVSEPRRYHFILTHSSRSSCHSLPVPSRRFGRRPVTS